MWLCNISWSQSSILLYSKTTYRCHLRSNMESNFFRWDWISISTSIKGLDGQSRASHLAQNLVFHLKMKHAIVIFYFIWVLVQLGLLVVCHVPMKDQIEDNFRSPMSSSWFLDIINKLVTLNIWYHANLRGSNNSYWISSRIFANWISIITPYIKNLSHTKWKGFSWEV